MPLANNKQSSKIRKEEGGEGGEKEGAPEGVLRVRTAGGLKGGTRENRRGKERADLGRQVPPRPVTWKTSLLNTMYQSTERQA
ncbi:Hypothetical predicted protein [Marmota monax]|uniref:Uncharacterized protein n=1 Tax=Marmota monax TaxID=9995 RepID=A0A5E4BSC8_MARMO|nr:Hypothetical predicted protein [Marmota monax]